MYAFIRGELITATHLYCVIDAGGVGYKLFTPARLLEKLPGVGKSVLLHTSLIIRENAHTLYGFHSVEEKDMFELLLSVSGVGPKIALSICGHLSPTELQEAIIGNNLVLLTKIPGIGKKTAERLVMDMKDKLKDLFPTIQSFVAFKGESAAIADAVSALIHLGYTPSTAQKAVKKSSETSPQSVDLATLITLALKHV